jgi:hypothetical protein
MIDKIDVVDRVGLTAPNRKSLVKGKMIAVRLHPHLFDALEELGGKKSQHIEKALRLYLLAMRAEEPDND